MASRVIDLVRMGTSWTGLRRGAVRLFITSVLALMASCRDKPAPLPPDVSVMRGIDHVLVVSSRADTLFSLFADTFECPVVWPMADHGGFASGGISLGNVTLEIIRDSAPKAGAAPSRFTGMALEPEPLDACLPALTARGIAFGRPAVHRSGWFTTRWTTVALPTVSSEDMNVFICEYGPTIRKDLPARRRRARETLDARSGGPLTLAAVQEVVIAAQDPTRSQARWQALLHPRRSRASGEWEVGAGPAIRIASGATDTDHIAALVIRVRSIDKARAFLRSHGMLGSDEAEQLSITAPDLGSVTIQLVSADSAGSAPDAAP